MPEYRKFRVTGEHGLVGTLFATSRFLDERKYKLLRLADGSEYLVPSDALEARADDSYHLKLSISQLHQYSTTETSPPPPTAEQTADISVERGKVIPAIQEEVDVSKRNIETGRVRIHKKVNQADTTVDEPLIKEAFEVRRVPINRIVDGPVETRQEGDTTIFPLLEEVLVIEKRLLLREELHVTRKREQVHDPQTVTLRKEEIEVERLY